MSCFLFETLIFTDLESVATACLNRSPPAYFHALMDLFSLGQSSNASRIWNQSTPSSPFKRSCSSNFPFIHDFMKNFENHLIPLHHSLHGCHSSYGRLESRGDTG
ncbi:hypothetical protein L1987_18290 [Smallanthus sonchifolius]|uniref:Uncharacterized protein n=1 Tax=Smallanthus sonchifolius TaxID=185202 RepID=A0ACB9IZ69_9ASTR|nr:hypothetical protein L1987_18290 [Smallanthus sonchifolius]